MDLEQRIGRIHRYGQKDTAQVYNLVLSDTIEGRIFLLLNDKLKEIAKTLGKVDENGEVAEDLRSQILGQLSERLRYEQLYSAAISDPELKRTKVELEAALSNASEAQTAVYELFQDLDSFSLDDYESLSDTTKGMESIVEFLMLAAQEDGIAYKKESDNTISISLNGEPDILLTMDRDQSLESDTLELLGLDHPIILKFINQYKDLPPEDIGIRVKSGDGIAGVLSIWFVTTQGERDETKNVVIPLAMDDDGSRVPTWEKQIKQIYSLPIYRSTDEPQHVNPKEFDTMLQRELVHRGVLSKDKGYKSRLIGWVEVH